MIDPVGGTVAVGVEGGSVDFAVRVIVERGPDQGAVRIIRVGLAPVGGAVIVNVEVGPGQAPGAIRSKRVVIAPVYIPVIIRIQVHPLPAPLRIQVGRPVDRAVIVEVEIPPDHAPGTVVVIRVVIDPVGGTAPVGVEGGSVDFAVRVIVERGPDRPPELYV